MDDVLKNHHNVLNMFPDVISQMFIVDGFKSIFITNFMCDVYRKVHHMKPQNYKPLLIVGPPRVGKTTTLIWLYLQFSYQGHKCFLAALDSEILNKIYHELEETDPTTPMYFFCDFNDALSAGRDTYKSYKNVVSKLLVCVNSVTVISASSALLTAMYNSENTALRSFVTHHLYHSSTIIEAKIEKKESKLLIEIALPTIANYDSVLEKTSGIPGFIYDYWSSETSQQAKNKIEHSILRSWREILPVINNAMFTEATVQLVVCLCNKITTIPFMALELVQCLPPVMGQLVEIDEKGIPHSNIGHTKAIFQSLFQSLDMQFLKTDESSALGFLYEPIACKVMELPNLMYLKFVCQTEATEVTGAQKFRAVKESMTRFPCCATLKRCTFSLQSDGQLKKVSQPLMLLHS